MMLNTAPAFASAPTTTLQGYYGNMDHQHQQHEQRSQQRMRRKRKADNDAGNERLSKRMSLLNLEQNGPKLYVPVEQSQLRQSSINPTPAALGAAAPNPIAEEEPMHLDDTAHKVYIYNLDDELSSDNESDAESRIHGDGKLVFLPDIEKHLRANRLPMVPRPILPNQDGELAGMQLVLYSDGPSSLTVPEEQDSVRKAIIEARARVRQRQAEERGAVSAVEVRQLDEVRNRSQANGNRSFATPVRVPNRVLDEDMMLDQEAGPSSSAVVAGLADDYDPDAMDID